MFIIRHTICPGTVDSKERVFGPYSDFESVLKELSRA